jgi:hypothetical protein
MKIIVRPLIIMILGFALLAACSSHSSTNAPSIYGRWAVAKVVYEDSSEKFLGAGNFVNIFDDYIVEGAQGYGKRRYPYERNQDALILMSGGESVVWDVVLISKDQLRINTPIGLYILDKNLE